LSSSSFDISFSHKNKNLKLSGKIRDFKKNIKREVLILLYYLPNKAIIYLSIYNCFSLDLYCWMYLGCSKTVIFSNNFFSGLSFWRNSAFFFPRTKSSEVSKLKRICFSSESTIKP